MLFRQAIFQTHLLDEKLKKNLCLIGIYLFQRRFRNRILHPAVNFKAVW